MGMTIDNALIHLKHGLVYEEYPLTKTDKQAVYITLRDAAIQYQMMQHDYQERLKADMVATLIDLWSRLDELSCEDIERISGQTLDTDDMKNATHYTIDSIQEIIQQKINTLRGENGEQS